MTHNVHSDSDNLPLDKRAKRPARHGTKRPVHVEIVKPKDGATVAAGAPVRLRAKARVGSQDLSHEVRWRSSRDGSLGQGRVVEAELSIGEHTLRATIRRPASRPGKATRDATARVTVNVSDPNKASDPTNYDDHYASDPTDDGEGSASDPTDCDEGKASDPTNYDDYYASGTTDCDESNASDPTNYGSGG